jgi:hypothetical protein
MADSDLLETVDGHAHGCVNSRDSDHNIENKREGTENVSDGFNEHMEKGSGSRSGNRNRNGPRQWY